MTDISVPAIDLTQLSAFILRMHKDIQVTMQNVAQLMGSWDFVMPLPADWPLTIVERRND